MTENHKKINGVLEDHAGLLKSGTKIWYLILLWNTAWNYFNSRDWSPDATLTHIIWKVLKLVSIQTNVQTFFSHNIFSCLMEGRWRKLSELFLKCFWCSTNTSRFITLQGKRLKQEKWFPLNNERTNYEIKCNLKDPIRHDVTGSAAGKWRKLIFQLFINQFVPDQIVNGVFLGTSVVGMRVWCLVKS